MRYLISISRRYMTIAAAIAVLLAVSVGVHLYEDTYVYSNMTGEEEIIQVLDECFRQRCTALVSGDISHIKNQFDTASTYGEWSYEHEIKRINYIAEWSKARDITLKECQYKLKIFSVKPSGGSVRIYLSALTRFSYSYNGSQPVDEFCLGTKHTIKLVKKQGSWMVTVDWYSDPLEDYLSADNYTPSSAGYPETYAYTSGWVKYNRTKALAYADKYCGALFDSVDGYKYNKKYRSYADLGGDCANFASQMLSDKEAGGMKMTGGWAYRKGEASKSWVNAGAFTRYLINSGRAKLVSKGKYSKVVNFTKYLSPGDKLPMRRKAK